MKEMAGVHDKLYIERAYASGFDGAAVMDTKDMVFDASFRRYCEENLCGNYGKNYGCPPDCGTPGQMKERVLFYRRALILQSVHTVSDYNDEAQISFTKGRHNKLSVDFIKELESEGRRGLTMLAGKCIGCVRCAKTKGLPCMYPDRLTSCLSAYCVNVAAMAEHCHIPYWCGKNKTAYFSVWLFDRK